MTPQRPSSSNPAVLKHTDPTSIEAQWGLRKLVVQQTETVAEGASLLSSPILQISASAVVKNPWIHLGVLAELAVSPQHIAARLAKLLSDRILEATGGATNIRAFGKGSIIGLKGELEHGAALTHSPYFASHLRQFMEGEAVISFSDTRGAAGESLVIPMCEKHTGTVRDYYQTLRVHLPDAPLPEEIVLIAAVSTRSRPFPRIGDRATDLPLNTSTMNGVFE